VKRSRVPYSNMWGAIEPEVGSLWCMAGVIPDPRLPSQPQSTARWPALASEGRRLSVAGVYDVCCSERVGGVNGG